MKTNVAIIGVGLIGGSLGMALKKRRPGKYHIIGIGRNAGKLALAKRRGAIDEVFTDFAAGVRDADIIVICSPVDTIGAIAGKIAPFIKKDAVITDVGSVKECVVKEVSAVLPAALRGNFVGAHPMAGAEKSGIAAADKEWSYEIVNRIQILPKHQYLPLLPTLLIVKINMATIQQV